MTIKFTASKAQRDEATRKVVSVNGTLEAGEPATSYPLTISGSVPVEAQLAEWCRERGLPVKQIAAVVTAAVEPFMPVTPASAESGVDPTAD